MVCESTSAVDSVELLSYTKLNKKNQKTQDQISILPAKPGFSLNFTICMLIPDSTWAEDWNLDQGFWNVILT